MKAPMSRACLPRLSPGPQEHRKGRHTGHRDDGEGRLQQFLLTDPGVQRASDVYGHSLSVALAGAVGVPLPAP